MSVVRSNHIESPTKPAPPPPPRISGKVVELDELPELLAPLRLDCKRIALCHGVFDLLHVGHIRHLAEAKTCAEILVVTVTGDRYVNKGPHRPAFSETLRCEALAALHVVDFVAINRDPLAVTAIDAVRPDVYVKGPDYANSDDDNTGNIVREAEAVAIWGGTIQFTKGEIFSSSHLLNRHMYTYAPLVEQYLEDFRSRHSIRDVTDALKSLRDLRVLVVGEAILDEYVYCDQLGKSSKEPVLAMRYKSKEVHAGGSLAVANHLADFCGSVELVTYLGERDGHEELVRSLLLPNVQVRIVYKTNSPTIVKRRYVESDLFSKLFEAYVINDELLEPAVDHILCQLLDSRVGDSDVVVVADFGHGLITNSAVDLLTAKSPFLAVNTQSNAANIGFHTISKYARADYICIHEGEVRLDARSRRGPLMELVNVLRARLQCDNVLVTQGKWGCSLFSGDVSIRSPALASNVVDRTGSGDAVLAVTSVLVANGVNPEVTAFIANLVGAQKVMIFGNRASIGRIATIKFAESLLK